MGTFRHDESVPGWADKIYLQASGKNPIHYAVLYLYDYLAMTPGPRTPLGRLTEGRHSYLRR